MGFVPIEGIGEEALFTDGSRPELIFRRRNLMFHASASSKKQGFDVKADLIDLARTIDKRIKRGIGVTWRIDFLAYKMFQHDYKGQIRRFKFEVDQLFP